MSSGPTRRFKSTSVALRFRSMSSFKDRIKITCPVCKLDMFIPPHIAKIGRRYCSQKCFAVAKTNNRVDRVCPHCAKEFQATATDVRHGRGKYCSVDCQHEASRKPNELAPRKINIARAVGTESAKVDERTTPIKRRNRGPMGAEASHSLYCRYICKAKERGIDFQLDEKTFLSLTSSPCYYCNIPPARVSKTQTPGKGDYQYNGIDRVDSSLGYTAGNVVACCTECNRGKSNRTAEEFLSWARSVSEFNPDHTTGLRQNPDLPYGEGCGRMKTLHRRYATSQRSRGILFDLDLFTFDALIRCQCNYCGQTPEDRKISNSKNMLKCNGLDRQDSALNYTVDNVVPCCKICNFAKNTLSVSDFYSWVNRIVAFQDAKLAAPPAKSTSAGVRIYISFHYLRDSSS